MSTLNKVWKEFLISIIKDTFGEFIDSITINERVDWIISKLHSIKPEKLFRNILYMMNNNPISKMAIGYKIRFLEDDYQVVFNDPYTEEFDRNNSLNKEDKKLILDILDNLGIAINHHIELLFINKKSDNNLFESIKQLSDHYNIPKFESMDNKMIQEGDLVYFMEFSQILYMVAFNQNPFNSEHCSKKTKKLIKDNFPERLQAMETLKERWQTGIPLKYVKSSKIF